ncbi:hypothetical protein [Amnibacterium soli]|uniref:hypothetical protein n=1 Tax=Amnibacterium soli TaxID=1282736 RepID=UPI0031E56514
MPAVAGLALLLVPVAALVVTNRDPDPLFLHYWWTPIASVPADSLLLGALGLALLLATAVAAIVATVSRRWYPRRGARLISPLLGLAVIASLIGISIAVSASRAEDSSAAIRAVLLRKHPATAVSGQARRAIELALGWPAPTAAGIRIEHRSTIPAGPWLVQTTEVLNQNLADEGADVTVETLIDPTNGSIKAAWFYGL